MKRLFFYFVALTISVSCTSAMDKRRSFVVDRNFDVGRDVNVVPVPEPIEVIELNKQKSKYIYEYKATQCRWFYIVDNKTQKILYWEYASDPNLCFNTINWGGPW